MSTYQRFGVPDNRDVHWSYNARYGPGLYYKALFILRYIDAAIHNSFVLGESLPPRQETVIPNPDNVQKKEEKYYHVGDHPDEPRTRTRRKKRFHKKNHNKKSRNKKNWRKNTQPDELDHDYYREYCNNNDMGNIDCRPEQLRYDQVYNEGYDQEYYCRPYCSDGNGYQFDDNIDNYNTERYRGVNIDDRDDERNVVGYTSEEYPDYRSESDPDEAHKLEIENRMFHRIMISKLKKTK